MATGTAMLLELLRVARLAGGQSGIWKRFATSATMAFCRLTQPAALLKSGSTVRLSQVHWPEDRLSSRLRKPFNTFAAELAPLLRRYFTSTTQNNDPEIYEKAYVGSDNITEYDRVLEGSTERPDFLAPYCI